MKKVYPLSVALFLGILLLLGGCVTPNQFPAKPHLLDFLQDGKTTKEETLLKLGQPSATLESEKYLTYRVGQDTKQGYFLLDRAPMGWAGVKYSLVLVFDPQGVLQKHSLVEVR